MAAPPAKTSPDISRRVRPVSIEDLAGKVNADGLWRLFDGDAGTTLAGADARRVRMTFSEPVAVTSVGAFGAKGGRVVLLGPDGSGGGEVLDATPDSDRWARAVVKAPRKARTFVAEWTPAGTDSALPELEVWARLDATSDRTEARQQLADTLFHALPVGSEVFGERTDARIISTATPADRRSFSISMPRDPRSIERAFLTYELDGLPHFTSVRRKINGAPALGGFAVSKEASGGPQVEEISPLALRSGSNTFEFLTVDDKDPVGYRIGNLRLVVTHASDTEAVDDGRQLPSQREAAHWEAENGALRRLRFSAVSQPRELRFNSPRHQQGKLLVAAGLASTRRTLTIDLGKLGAGRHTVSLDGFPAVDEITLGFEGPQGRTAQLADLSVDGSPLPDPRRARFRLTHPLHGECVDHRIHVRGLAASRPSEIRAAGAAVAGAQWEPGAFSFTALEKDLGGRNGEPFSFRVDAMVDGARVDVDVPISGCTDRPPAVAGTDGAPAQPREDVGAPYGVVVKAKKASTLSFAGVELEVPAGAVEKDVRVTIRPLAPTQVAPLDAGMTNVTVGGKAFRFGPRGMVFKKAVTMSIPVETSRVAPGDVPRAFYFDEKAKLWRDVDSAPSGRSRVLARTTHFTDFVAGTLALPEHPGVQSLDPTSLKQIKIADPGAGVTQIAPPQANSMGTANLDYPIEVPPGRLGMEPKLAITYDSERANGWLGVGWDLTTSAIEVDTRFGVPKYDGNERYLLDGEALTPASQPPTGAPAGTYYVRRREAQFDWIQRVGVSGGGYAWTVTDRKGVKYTYGDADTARVTPLNGTCTAAVNRLRTFKWFLTRAEDIHGNRVNYTYAAVCGNNGDPWVQVYPSQIAYTASASGTPAAPYSVRFNLTTTRVTVTGTPNDAFSTGRPGFQVLTNRLLDSVEVRNGTTIVRKYQLTYKAGDFGKNVLDKISLFGRGGTGTALAVHSFGYWQTPTNGGAPAIFGNPTQAGPYTTIFDGQGNHASEQSLRDIEERHSSNSITIGIGTGGESTSTRDGHGKLADMNGDGLPDYLPFIQGSTLGGRQRLLRQSGVLTGPMTTAHFLGLTRPYSIDTNINLSSSYTLLGLTGSEDYGNLSQTKALHMDVNGDGIPDEVTGAADGALHVRLALPRLRGFLSEMVMPGYDKSGLAFDCSDILPNGGTLAAPAQAQPFPSADVITKWVAPYAGTVRITGQITRQEEGGDGMVASLYHRNTKLWEREVGPNDLLPTSPLSSCTPADGGASVGSGCDSTHNVGILRTVTKGDRIYTRVNAINNAEHDGLKWDTTIVYVNAPASQADAREAWGPQRYKWSEANDQRVVGAFYRPWTARWAGDVHVTLRVAKDPTADDVQVLVQLLSRSGTATTFGTLNYTSAQTVSSGSPPIELDAPFGLGESDQIHVTIKSDTPIDPKTIRVLATVQYTRLCRDNPFEGSVYCGYPRCTALDDGGASCTIESSPNSSGASDDPLVEHPLPGSMLYQVVPTYYPLQRWVFEPRPNVPPNPPTTGLDGRRKVMSTSTANTPRLCYSNFGPNNGQTALLVIQTVNRLLAKERRPLTQPEDGLPCLSAPAVASGQQVFFSIYSEHPIPTAARVTAHLSSTDVSTGLEIYRPDPSLPPLNRFPSVGGMETMSAGYHDFFMGLWNGNAAFDEAFIDGVGNANYAPMYQAPIPRGNDTGGNLAFFDLGDLNPIDWVKDAYHYVSSFADYIWDKASALVKVIGSACIEAVRWLGSVVGKIMAWVFCELSGAGYEADGIRVTESHNRQEGVGVFANVARGTGFSVNALDLVDMNGDRYPDQVSSRGIRYAYFDPQTNEGRFCPTPQTSATCAAGTPTVIFPDKKISEVRHVMHSASLAASWSPVAEAQEVDSGNEPSGVQAISVGASRGFSQGYSHTKRDLRDMNGDGLPDIVEVNNGQCTGTGYGLCVQLNYGYSFSARIPWTSPNWSVPEPTVVNMLRPSDPFVGPPLADLADRVQSSVFQSDRPTSQTIRLDEEGHKGGEENIGPFGRGLDQTYVRTLVDLVDINGDGLPDQIMKLPGQPYRVKLNTGSEFLSEIAVTAHAWPTRPVWRSTPEFPILSDTADVLAFRGGESTDKIENHLIHASSLGTASDKTALELMDIDGDGRLDQVLKPGHAPLEQYRDGNVWARLNQTGKSNLLSTVTLPLGGRINLDYDRQLNATASVVAFPGETREVELTEGRWALHKVSVTDNRSNTYTDTLTYDMNASGTAITSGYYDRAEREFLGFGHVWVSRTRDFAVIAEGDGSAKWMFFHNQNVYERGRQYAELEMSPDEKVLRGWVTRYSLTTHPLSSSSRYVGSARTIDMNYEGSLSVGQIKPRLAIFDVSPPAPDAPLYHLTWKQFDAEGRLATFIDERDPASAADGVHYQLGYATFTGQAFTAVNRVTTHRTSDGAILANREATYTLTNGRPLLTQVREFVYGGNQPVSGTPYTGQAMNYALTYDAADLGNPKTLTAPTGNVLTYVYDTTTKTHAVQITDSFNVRSSSTINYDFGLPATTTDGNSKLVTYQYDAFGRLNKVWGPTDPTSGQATIEMTYSQGSATAAAVPWAQTRHKDFQSTTGDTIDTVTFADGIGRLIQTKKEAELLQSNGTTVRGFDISGLVVFDERGRVMAQHQPFFNSTTAATTLVPAPIKNPTVYTYDSLGRVTSTITEDDALTTTTYSYVPSPSQSADDAITGFTGSLGLTTVTDANGHPTRVYRNGPGEVMANKRFVTIAGTRQPVLTKYGYDLLGNVATVTDAKGNVISGGYDSLSRLISLASPDGGRTEWRYGLTGLLAEKQTANLRANNNQLIKYTYDRHRLTTIDYPSMPDVTFTYGLTTDTTDVSNNRLGRIKTVTMEGGSETRSYDAFGNVSQTVTTLKHIGSTTTSPVATMKFSYDWLGRMRTMTFPRVIQDNWTFPTGDGEVLTFTYDKGGMIDKISGKATPTSTAVNYLNDVGYDDFGSRANLVTGNGINTKYTYSLARHFLNTVTASGRAPSGIVQFLTLSYTYDLVGNVLTFFNSPPASALQSDSSQVGVGPHWVSHSYDELDRLRDMTALYRGHVSRGYSANTTLTYDTIDNITSKAQNDTRLIFTASDSGLNGGDLGPTVQKTTYSLTYNYTNQTKAHQPATISDTTGGSTQTRTMRYDSNGNHTGDTIGTTTRTLVWDEEDRLKSVTRGTTTLGQYLYSPDGQRTQKRDDTNTTTFYFNQFLVVDGNRRMTKHIFAGDTRIASKTESVQMGTTSVVHFYHPDHLGSTSYTSDTNQNLVQHERYFPYGERWAEQGFTEQAVTNTLPRDYLFTGKEYDRSTEFYYFGARYMDPRTSMWLSTDPILDRYVKGEVNDGVFEPKNLALYAYAANNPILLTDPNGENWIVPPAPLKHNEQGPLAPNQTRLPAPRPPLPQVIVGRTSDGVAHIGVTRQQFQQREMTAQAQQSVDELASIKAIGDPATLGGGPRPARVVYRELSLADRQALERGEGLTPKGRGGSIVDHVKGQPTGWISASETPDGTRRYARGNGLVEIDVDAAMAAGAGYADHKNVVQAVRRDGTSRDIQNAVRAREVLFRGPIPPSAVRLVKGR